MHPVYISLFQDNVLLKLVFNIHKADQWPQRGHASTFQPFLFNSQSVCFCAVAYHLLVGVYSTVFEGVPRDMQAWLILDVALHYIMYNKLLSLLTGVFIASIPIYLTPCPLARHPLGMVPPPPPLSNVS